MMLHSLGKKERALSLWAQDRLHERPAIEWATKSVKRIRGSLSAELVGLFAFLEEQARKSGQLAPSFKKVWHLFRVVAQESTGAEGPHDIYDLREELKAGNIQPEFAARLIDLVRPRLTVDAPWKFDEAEKQEDPIRWVRWEFKNRAGSLNRFEARFSRADLDRLPDEMLVRIIERGTDALKDALVHAEHLGWFERGVDMSTYYVSRVVAPDDLAYLVEESPEDEEERDPDTYNEDFAPLVRVLSTSFECLILKNVAAARGVCARWDHDLRGLLVRLAGFARWQREVKSANEVAAFLLGLAERPFWIWNHYPEIATARALRWNELNAEARKTLEQRLMAGPNAAAFGEGADLRSGMLEYYRDHELARLLDNNAELSGDANALIATRRAEDGEFPKRIPAVEPGPEGVRVTRHEDGNAKVFDDVPVETLLEQLQKTSKQHDFRRGDDSEAFASTLAGKMKILAALERPSTRGDLVDTGWPLLLSNPPRKPEEQADVREYIERTAALALQLATERFSALSDRLSYWLDAVDEAAPESSNASTLWLRLLPYAAEQAQSFEASTQSGDSEKRVDLTSAALNEPLGHLLSIFLRRCPPGSPEKPPVLPPLYSVPLKNLTGRARELLANRMAVAMRYFALADPDWLDRLVVEPMMSELPEGDRVWEAFARYGHIPPAALWERIETLTYHRLANARLTPEGRRRVVEMAVIAWAWTKRPDTEYRVNSPGLRSALALAPEDVRVQAAWMFRRLFKDAEEASSEAGDAWVVLGPPFFAEVWPLEPALQSAGSGNHFAEVPTRVRAEHFVEAVDQVLPYVRPFEIWSVKTELGLDIEKPTRSAIVEAHPETVLRLLSASIGETIRHSVMGLGQVLDLISKVAPKLERDPRMRELRRIAGD